MIKFKKLGPEVVERLHRLPRIFSEYSEVVVVYLFGSFAKGEVKPLSDIDIAYLLHPQLSEDYMGKDLGLQAAISRALGTDEVDCYLLNKHPEVLLELSEDLPVRDPESGQNGEELPHSLLSDTGHDLPCLGLFPEGQAELVVVQGGSRGSEDKAGVVKDKLLHGPSRLYANPVKSSLGNGTASRSKKRSAGGLIH